MSDAKNRKVEEMRRLAAQLRRHADESTLPDYAAKLLRSAVELEVEADTLLRQRLKTH